MNYLSENWRELLPILLVVVGFLLVVVGFIGRRRQINSFDNAETEKVAARPKLQMAPLPKLLSSRRASEDD